MLVVHPKIRWGPNAKPDEDVELRLEEACALVKTLPGFTVTRFILSIFIKNANPRFSTMIIGTDYSVRKKMIWGKGRVDALKEHQVQSNATAVMINVDILSPLQQVRFYACRLVKKKSALSNIFK